MVAVDAKIESKVTIAQQAEEIKQTATSTAQETLQTIQVIEEEVKQTARKVHNIADLKQLEAELQVSQMLEILLRFQIQ